MNSAAFNEKIDSIIAAATKEIRSHGAKAIVESIEKQEDVNGATINYFRETPTGVAAFSQESMWFQVKIWGVENLTAGVNIRVFYDHVDKHGSNGFDRSYIAYSVEEGVKAVGSGFAPNYVWKVIPATTYHEVTNAVRKNTVNKALFTK